MVVRLKKTILTDEIKKIIFERKIIKMTLEMKIYSDEYMLNYCGQCGKPAEIYEIYDLRDGQLYIGTMCPSKHLTIEQMKLLYNFKDFDKTQYLFFSQIKQ